MLRALLEDRFKLRVHRETRQMKLEARQGPVEVLVVDAVELPTPD
jgi:hypothetical protein